MFHICSQMWQCDDQLQLSLTSCKAAKVHERMAKWIYLGYFIISLSNVRSESRGKKVSDQTAKLSQCSRRSSKEQRDIFDVSLKFLLPFETQRHSLVAAKVTNLLVWVQQIRFRKQSGAASQPECVLKPRRRTVCAPVNLLILRPAAALSSLGLISNDLPLFLLLGKKKYLWPNKFPPKIWVWTALS